MALFGCLIRCASWIRSSNWTSAPILWQNCRVTLVAFAAFSRQALPTGADIARAPWWMWTGGFFGATFILMAVIATPVLGAALMLASSIVGQLGAALVIDHYGLFGATVIPITATRVIGVTLLAVGVILIRWT